MLYVGIEFLKEERVPRRWEFATTSFMVLDVKNRFVETPFDWTVPFWKQKKIYIQTTFVILQNIYMRPNARRPCLAIHPKWLLIDYIPP